MKIKGLGLFLILLTAGHLLSVAQSAPEFYPEVWRITQSKCTPCHQEGGTAPFALETAEDFRERARFIDHVVSTRYMPPWPADPNYRSFANEHRLSDQDLSTLRTWLNSDLLPGPTPPKTKKRRSHCRSKAPLELKPESNFAVPTDNKDHFVWFLLPEVNGKDLHLTDIEFQPGDRRVVHHMELLAAPPGTFFPQGKTVFSDSLYYGTGFDELFGRGFRYLAGWLPGNQGEHYPSGSGIVLEKGSQLLLMVHYAPNSIPIKDRSAVRLHRSPDDLKFRVESIDLHTPEDFLLPANEVTTLSHEFLLREEFSVFAVFPHAHHLCQEMTARAMLPSGEEVPLLHIPRWDFDWQFTYYLREYLYLPAGTRIVFEATYDNTEQNPENPHHPPQNTEGSFRSEDEMMELFLWGFKGKERPELGKSRSSTGKR